VEYNAIDEWVHRSFDIAVAVADSSDAPMHYVGKKREQTEQVPRFPLFLLIQIFGVSLVFSITTILSWSISYRSKSSTIVQAQEQEKKWSCVLCSSFMVRFNFLAFRLASVSPFSHTDTKSTVQRCPRF
jgi:hypothetical protein